MSNSEITLNKPGSCFLDACALALGVPANVVQAYIRHHFPGADCDQKGYHVTYLNIALLELYKIGLSQVDPRPLDFADGETSCREGVEKVTEHITKWFARPNFRCVVTGPLNNESGGEHANAWVGDAWVDPANPTVGMSEPNVGIRSIWLTTLPPQQEGASGDQA